MSQGVSWCKQEQRYRAYAHKDGKFLHVGRFDSLEAAVEAHLVAKNLERVRQAELFKDKLDPRVYKILIEGEFHA